MSYLQHIVKFSSIHWLLNTFIPLCLYFVVAREAMIAKSGNNELEFFFAKLAGADKYKKKAWEMYYCLKAEKLEEYIFLVKKNPRMVIIAL